MPLILHAAWLHAGEALFEGQLFLWAEDFDPYTDQQIKRSTPSHPSLSTPELPNGRSARQRSAQTPSHPTQAQLNRLRSQISGYLNDPGPAGFTSAPVLHGGGDSATELRPTSVTVWLPSVDGMPLARRSPFQQSLINGGSSAGNGPSPAGAAVEPHATAANLTDADLAAAAAPKPVLLPWQVTGITLSPAAALRFLNRLESNSSPTQQNKPAFASHFRLGKDMLFWSNAAKFALEVLVGQHYLPSLQGGENGALRALWQPLLLEPQMQERFDHLAENMPPVCRAYELENLDDAPAPAALLPPLMRLC